MEFPVKETNILDEIKANDKKIDKIGKLLIEKEDEITKLDPAHRIYFTQLNEKEAIFNATSDPEVKEEIKTIQNNMKKLDNKRIRLSKKIESLKSERKELANLNTIIRKKSDYKYFIDLKKYLWYLRSEIIRTGEMNYRDDIIKAKNEIRLVHNLNQGIENFIDARLDFNGDVFLKKGKD